jgi:hypothetical protein
MSQSALERTLFILLLLAYLVIGALYALRTPLYDAPDEPAHYNYVEQVRLNGCCPVIEVGDWDSPYLDQLKAAHFTNPDLLTRIDTVQYEDHQPPLYYLLASVVARVTDSSQTALRLFSVLIGAGVVIGAYGTAKALLPSHPQIALGAAALVAFVPQHLAMLAAINNDGLAELIVAVTLWLTVLYLKTERVRVWQLGILVGLGLLTKASTIFLVGIVPLAIVAKWWIKRDPNAPPSRTVMTELGRVYVRGQGEAPPFGLVRGLIVFAVIVVIMGGVWWLRNLSIYGVPDIFGLGRHNLVVADQLRTADLIAQVGVNEYLRRGIETTFNSFWGQFGWMALPLPSWMYAAILIFLALVAVGWVIGWARRLAPEPDGAAQRAAWLILSLTAALAVLQYLYYNTEFVQFQGRYMYPGLIPLGVWIALGVDGWRRLAFDREGRTGQPAGALRPYSIWFTPAVIGLLIPLNLYILWRVLPGLTA